MPTRKKSSRTTANPKPTATQNNRTHSSSSRRRAAASVAASVPVAAAASPQGEVCSICIEPLKGKKKKYTTECNHIFHQACLKTTCKTHQKCPLCREDIQLDCREIIGAKANEMPSRIIRQLLEYTDKSNVDKMRTALLGMKFPRETNFENIYTFRQAFAAQTK